MKKSEEYNSIKNSTPVPSGVIDEDSVREAEKILQKYKSAKMNLDRRIIDNEQWYKMRHWDTVRKKNEPAKRASAWLFNSIAHKHADFMDALPECTVLPREESDSQAAQALTGIIPVVFEQNGFESIYSDATLYKLKNGTSVYSVLWNPQADNGVGNIDIKQTDILNLFWEPGVKDIQKSRNLFHVSIADNDILLAEYPVLEGRLGNTASPETEQYVYDESIDTSEKSAVTDWYYKKKSGNREVLHYCKFCCGTLLYASENDPLLAHRGWYDHGRYPFVFDVLFREEGTPAGFGFIDIMKNAQEEIDELENEIMRNARLAARRRYFSRDDGAVNEEEFADFGKDIVHVSGASLGEDSLREIRTAELPSVYVTILNNKIAELKETSSNRDFSQGSTTGGVTSGVAIAALQEAGSKVSRNMVTSSYRAYAEVCTLGIELVRQFYSVPRCFRILGENGAPSFVSYDNSAIIPGEQESDFGVELGSRLPVFDVKVRAHKQNPFSRSAQNQDAMNFFSMGFFDPSKSEQALACLELLDLENKDKIVRVIRRNGEKYAMTAHGEVLS